MRVSEREWVEQLWLPRIYRKVPRQLCPDTWRQLHADYTEQWCKSTGTPHRRLTRFECICDRDSSQEGLVGNVPDLDAIRCIVFGWSEGAEPKELARSVERWRDELEPAMQWLDPVTRNLAPGPLLFAYVTEELPAMRAQLGQAIDHWVDSPPAVQGLLREFAPVSNLLTRLRGHLPGPYLHDQTSSVLGAIALHDELVALHRLVERGARLADLLDDVERSLKEMGWQMTAGGKLKRSQPRTRGRKPTFLVQVICGLYSYLRPFYQEIFGDRRVNPAPLRAQISLLLSPYFERSEVSPAHKGPIARAINNRIRGKRT